MFDPTMQRIAPTTKNLGALNFSTAVVEKSCTTHYLCLQHLVLAPGNYSVLVEPVGAAWISGCCIPYRMQTEKQIW